MAHTSPVQRFLGMTPRFLGMAHASPVQQKFLSVASSPALRFLGMALRFLGVGLELASKHVITWNERCSACDAKLRLSVMLAEFEYLFLV